MITCRSCKSRKSDTQCPNKALKGLVFCGKHAKVKDPKIWKDVRDLDSYAIIIQKNWRRYTVRNWIKENGPGALDRRVCHNQEDLFTLDDCKSVNPFNYFSFEENGKVFWFDIRTLVEECFSKLKPTNPYTREPLSIETRMRLRKLCIKRHRLKIPVDHGIRVEKTIEEIVLSGWTQVCQIIHENGFYDLSPELFAGFSRIQLYLLSNIILKDLVAFSAEHKSDESRRRKYPKWMKSVIMEFNRGIEYARFSVLVSKVLTTILNDCPAQYDICFIIMSALYRL